MWPALENIESRSFDPGASLSFAFDSVANLSPVLQAREHQDFRHSCFWRLPWARTMTTRRAALRRTRWEEGDGRQSTSRHWCSSWQMRNGLLSLRSQPDLQSREVLSTRPAAPVDSLCHCAPYVFSGLRLEVSFWGWSFGRQASGPVSCCAACSFAAPARWRKTAKRRKRTANGWPGLQG